MGQKLPRLKVVKRESGGYISVEVGGHQISGSRVINRFEFIPNEDTGVEIKVMSEKNDVQCAIISLTWDEWVKLSSFLSASRYPEMWQTSKPSTSR